MSQVRKFVDGGTTPAQDQTTVKKLVPGRQAVVIEQPTTPETPVEEGPKSYIILNGEKFENTEENRQTIRNEFARIADPNGGDAVLNEVAELADKAAAEGGSIVYNTPGNQFSYVNRDGVAQNIDWKDLNRRQEARLGRKRSWLGKVIDAYANSDVQQYAVGLSKLSGLANVLRNKNTSTTADTSNLLNIGKGGWWDYLKDDKGLLIKDENGNLKYDINSAENSRLQTMIQRALTAVGMTPEDAKKHFSWDNGAFKNGFDELKSVMGNDPETWKANLNAVLDKVEAGNPLSPEDMSILKVFGIFPDATQQNLTPEQKAALEKQAIKEKWKAAGLEGIYDKAHTWFDLGDDNILSLNDTGSEALAAAGLSRNGGYELNNEWLDYLRAHDYDPTNVEFLNGYTLYNGKLYKTSTRDDANSALANIYRTSGYYDKNSQNLYGDAQKIINSMWGNPYTWTTPESPYYSNFSYDKETGKYRTGRRYRSANGLYTWADMGDKQIVQYYDLDATRDSSGFVTDNSIKYAITDKFGNVLQDNLSEQDLENQGITRNSIDGRTINFGDQENTTFNQRELLQSEDPRLHNHYVVSYGEKGTANEWAVYVNPFKSPSRDDPSSWTIIKIPGEDSGYTIPPLFSRILFQKNQYGEDGLQRILKDRKAQGYLRDILEATTKTAMGRIINSSDSDRTINWLCKYLGIDEEARKEINKEYLEMIRANQNDRKDNFLVNFDSINQEQVPVQKTGGTIPSFKPGGGFGKSAGASKSSEAKNTKFNDSREYGKVKDFGNHMTDADWADIAGLVADITSLGLTFAPGVGNLAAAGVGAAGSLSGLYADIRHDGFQGKDLRDFGLNILMDLGTALPGVGTGAKAGKLAAKARKMGQTLLKAASIAGVSSGVYNIAQNVAAGKDVTWRDLRTLVNAITAGSNLRKLGGFGKATKRTIKEPELTINSKGQRTIEPKGLEIKAKSGKPEDSIFLSKEDVDSINSIPDPIAKNKKLGEIVARKKGWNASDPDYATKIDSFDYDGSGIGRVNSNNVREIGTLSMPSSKKIDYEPIKLTKSHIDKINAAKSNAEKEKVLVDIVKKETGDSSLDSIDKVKEAFDVDALYKSSRKRELSFNPKKSIIGEKVNEITEIKPKKEKGEDVLKEPSNNSFVNWWRGTGTSKQWFPGRGIAEADRAGYREAFLREGIKPPTTRVVGPGHYETIAVVPGNGSNPNNLPATVSHQANYVPNVQEKVSPNWMLGYRQLFDKGLGRQHIVLQRPLEEGTPAPGQTGDTTATSSVHGFKQGGILKAEGGSSIYGNETIEPKKLKTPDPQDILEFSKYLVNLTNSNKMLKLANSAYDNMPRKQAMTYTMPTFTDNGLINAGNNTIQGIYNRQPANYTSDANINNFVRKGNQEKATEYQNKFNAQLSGLIGQYNQKNWKIENKNRASQLETAYDNQMQGWKVQQMKSNNRQVTLNANNASLNNLITYGIGKLKTQQTKADALKDSFNTAFTSMDAYRNLVKDDRYKQTMGAFNTYKKSHADATFSDWIIGDGASYANAYGAAQKEASAKAKLNLSAIDLSELGPYGKGVVEDRNRVYNAATEAGLISSAKSGGTISAKKSNYRPYRDYREQIEIDNNKEIRKAINQLNKNTQQLLLKMLK